MSSSADAVYERIRRGQEAQSQRQRLEIANTLDDEDYDRAARIWAAEARTKLPYEVVDADLDNIEDQVRKNSFNYEDYTDQINGAPAFNRFAAENPFHLTVLKRDHKDLSALERAYRRMSLGWQSGDAMIEVSQIRDRQLKNFDNPDNERDAARLEALRPYMQGQSTYFGAENWFAKMLVGTANQIPVQEYLIGESLDEIAIGAATYGGVAAAAGFAGPQAAIPEEIVTVPVAMAMGARHGFVVGRTEAAFRMERGLAYDELLEMGLNEEEARWASTAVGGVNAALESIGLGALTKRVPGFNKIMKDRVGAVINSTLTKPTMRHAIARASLQYGEAVATELVTEVFQEATVIAAGELLKANERERGNLDPSMDAMGSGEFWNRVGEIATHTLYGTALIAGVGPTTTFIGDSNRAWMANRMGTALDQLGEAAEASETRKNVPTKYAELVEEITGDGETVLVDKTGFIEYFQSQGMDVDEVAASVGVDLNADPGAMDVAIPAKQYLTKIAPNDHHKGLKKDIRENADAMTIREAEAFEKHRDTVEKEILAAAVREDPKEAAEDNAAVERWKQDLVEAGTSPEAAEHQAQLARGITNLARRAGKDPMTFFNERYAGVVATTNAQMAAQKDDVDIYVDPYLDRIRSGDLPQQRDIFGPSAVDRIRALGGLAPDAEIEARDLQKSFRGLVKDTGDTLDGIAETLHEEGYIAARDPALVLEALEREELGELVFGAQQIINEEQRELLGQLEQLSSILDQAGIDITDMSNAEVRKAMAEIESFFQTDDEIGGTALDDLTELALTAARHDPQMLAKLELSLPRIAPIQDFGDVKFTDEYVLPDGRKVTRTRAANKEFEMAKKRKNVLEKLKECLGG